jgi:hypothetical protein
MLESRITIITIAVSDLEKSKNFYQKILGFKLSKHSVGDFVMFETGGTRLSLFPRDEFSKEAGKNMSSPNGFAFSYNVKTKEEVDDILEEVKKLGATVTKEPAEEEWGGYSGYFEGPDGELWQIAYNSHFWLE